MVRRIENIDQFNRFFGQELNETERQFDMRKLKNMVKRQTHITAQEYIHGKLLEKAKALLLHSGQPVNEIAEQLGFAYSNHFTRFFRAKTGMSPSDYRKKG